MREFIMRFDDGIYNDETGEAVFKPEVVGELVLCKDCRKHNKGINEAEYLKDRCPLILHRGYAHGHEFDYQYCIYGERKDGEA